MNLKDDTEQEISNNVIGSAPKDFSQSESESKKPSSGETEDKETIPFFLDEKICKFPEKGAINATKYENPCDNSKDLSELPDLGSLSKSLLLKEKKRKKLEKSELGSTRVRRELRSYPFHEWSSNEILEFFQSDLKNGLDSQSVKELRNLYGWNEICENPFSKKELFQKNLFGNFNIILWIGSFLYFLIYLFSNFSDYQSLFSFIICIILLITLASFSTFNKLKLLEIDNKQKKWITSNVRVRRDSETVDLDPRELVPGDIIEIGGGEIVPADIRILECADLKINNSIITG
jgi:magnesium-transporting ATPase (P-type)